MSKEIKNISNRVERSYEGKCYAFWRGRIVYEHQKTRVRRFKGTRSLGISCSLRRPWQTRLGSWCPLYPQKRTFAVQNVMSALPPIADIVIR